MVGEESARLTTYLGEFREINQLNMLRYMQLQAKDVEQLEFGVIV